MNWLWWQHQRAELHFLRAGKNRGLFLAQIGALLGISKQGALDRMDRLEALFQHDRPDEKLSREARRAQRDKCNRTAAEQAWLGAHREELATVITGLVREADHYTLDDDDRQWTDELASDAHDDHLTSATIVILGLAVAELRTAAPILALTGSRPHPVHSLLGRAEVLCSRFAEIRARSLRTSQRV